MCTPVHIANAVLETAADLLDGRTVTSRSGPIKPQWTRSPGPSDSAFESDATTRLREDNAAADAASSRCRVASRPGSARS
jgi:hypothetical protein